MTTYTFNGTVKLSPPPVFNMLRSESKKWLQVHLIKEADIMLLLLPFASSTVIDH